MAVKEMKFTKTPFRKQGEVISGILKTNPILNDDEKASLNETVGLLQWLNQLQIHWAGGNDGIPPALMEHIFAGRKPQVTPHESV
jgi:hypothetical protein